MEAHSGRTQTQHMHRFAGLRGIDVLGNFSACRVLLDRNTITTQSIRQRLQILWDYDRLPAFVVPGELPISSCPALIPAGQLGYQ